jgi:hypothetical protein
MILFVVTAKQTLGGVEGQEVKVFTSKPRAEAHAKQRVADAEKGGWPPVTVTVAEAGLDGGTESDMLRAAFATIYREVPGRYSCLENVLRLAPLAAHVEFNRIIRFLTDEARHIRPQDVIRALTRGGR